MFLFYAESERYTDEDGNLTDVLVEWSEDCEESSDFLRQAQLLIVAAAFGAIFLASFEPPKQPELFMIAGGLAVLEVAILLFGHRFCTVHRKLWFHDNGAIAIPRGWLGRLLLGPKAIGDHRELTSIETQEAETLQPDPHKRKRYEVWLYYRDGSVDCIAGSLYQWQAHKVSVQLTLAHADLKTAMARLPQANRPADPNWGYATVE